MKFLSVIVVVCGVLMAAFQIRTGIVSKYRFEKDYTQYWSLADKSSTIQAKQQYITQFVTALRAGAARGEFAANNAMWLKTTNNSFTANLTALESLERRLSEIQTLNPNSFEYNTAIGQITAQEQGEASAMMEVFRGCYTLESYPMAWGWIRHLFVLLELIIVIGGLSWVAVEYNW